MTDIINILRQHSFLVIALVKCGLLLFIILTVLAYLSLFERKVLAHIQSRWGPYRVGPHGLLQPLADGLKFLFKEDPMPAGVDRFVFLLAPFLSLALALTSLAVIPFGPQPLRFSILGTQYETSLGIVDLNIGLLVLFAITALGVYGVALAGWASNSKYPLLGGLRSSAQMMSYELALTMSVVGVILMAGSFNLREIVTAQEGRMFFGLLPRWNVIAGPFPQIIGFFCYFVAAIAETNRAPFDLPEAESELVAGFNTEYASFKFAMFFMGEYANMITVSCLATIMFFGGWTSPFPSAWSWTHFIPSALLAVLGVLLLIDGIRYETILGKLVLPGVGTALCALSALLLFFAPVNNYIQGPFWFLLKVFIFIFFYVWMRGTLPRFRYDQLMAIGWKILLPLSIANVLLTSLGILKWGLR